MPRVDGTQYDIDYQPDINFNEAECVYRDVLNENENENEQEPININNEETAKNHLLVIGSAFLFCFAVLAFFISVNSIIMFNVTPFQYYNLTELKNNNNDHPYHESYDVFEDYFISKLFFTSLCMAVLYGEYIRNKPQ